MSETLLSGKFLPSGLDQLGKGKLYLLSKELVYDENVLIGAVPGSEPAPAGRAR